MEEMKDVENVIEVVEEQALMQKIHTPHSSPKGSFLVNDRMEMSTMGQLREMHRSAKESESLFVSKETHCKLFYYTTGIITLIINVVISSISASTDITGARVIFILSIIGSILTSIVNFLKIESKITKLEDYKKSYRDYRIRTWDTLRKPSGYSDTEVETLVNDLRNLENQTGDLKVKLICF